MPSIETEGGQLTNRSDICRFVLGDWNRESHKWGHKVLTLESAKTGKHFTFKVLRRPNSRPLQPWIVKVLCGPDNRNDYQNLGSLHLHDGPEYYAEFRSHAAAGTTGTAAAAFGYLTERVLNFEGVLPPSLNVYHEGRCGICAKRLTTPESVSRGIGPTCFSRL